MDIIEINSKIKPYKVIIDDKLESLLDKELLNKNNYLFFIDEKLKDITKIIKNKFPYSKIILLRGGENIKTIENYSKILSKLIKLNVDRLTYFVSIGGGTILDFVGFLASTYKRGVKYISIPTTTLAMVDVCIGGKVGLNFLNTKNVIGSFYPPQKVLIGVDTLNSLDKRQFNNGLFEALKMGLSLNKKLYEDIKKNCDIKKIIYESLLTKKAIIEKDEDENNVRKILNFGHTLGHALELNYSLLHGEAVALGMLFMLKDTPLYEEVKKVIKNMGLEIKNEFFDKKIIEQIKNDKKIKNKKITCVKLKTIGEAFLEEKEIKYLLKEIKEYGK